METPPRPPIRSAAPAVASASAILPAAAVRVAVVAAPTLKRPPFVASSTADIAAYVFDLACLRLPLRMPSDPSSVVRTDDDYY